MKHTHFPLFLPSMEKKVLLVGGGNIGTRRVETLLQFQFHVKVVSLKASATLEKLALEGAIELCIREPVPEDFSDIFLCLLATNHPSVNEHWGSYAKEKGILCNQAHDKSLCDFYFPAVVERDGIVLGLVGDGSSHKRVKEVRQILDSRLDVTL